MKGIKQRINNVSSTRQIIRAMDMVAGTKLHKARARLDGIRPLYHEMQERIAALSHCEEAASHLFAARRPIKHTAYVVITSNKGLCGGYNNNVSELALAHMEQAGGEKVIAVGAKGAEYFRRAHKNILYRITDIPEVQVYETAARLGELAASLYLSGEADEVYVAYTHFESTLSHQPRLERVLPLPVGTGGALRRAKMKYEPDVHTFIDHITPMYLHTCFFAASSEALACEYAARMVAMDSAGKNATEVLDDLRRMYNRKRQAAITQELSEIVGGANILDQGGI
ncbi:MAG: ATP synthase F1 subunit gamma [Clostridiales bacterium]|nr:ATP synthase F1 subunit gamma [Clostridiales bacterium]